MQWLSDKKPEPAYPGSQPGHPTFLWGTWSKFFNSRDQVSVSTSVK